jgi:hypothetical protein
LQQENKSNIEMTASDLSKQVYSMLDYSLKTSDERKAVVQKIQDEYGLEIESRYEYYAGSNLNKYDNYQQYQAITRLMEAMADYVLMSDDVKKNKTWTSTRRNK